MPDLNDMGSLRELRDLIIHRLELVGDNSNNNHDDCEGWWDQGIDDSITAIEKLFEEFGVKPNA